jgi:hypothetical protein
MEGVAIGHIFERDPHRDHYCQVWFNLVQRFQTVLYPRWPPLLKIEISSNDQNCSILSQNVPIFELYQHNDDLFNIYYGIFYEL